MITLQANNPDLLKIQSELDLKIGGIEELSSKEVLQELANAVFTVSGKSFIKAINMQAKANPKAYHHIYEWNRVGVSSSRLFFLYKASNSNGSLVVKPGFKKSTTKVPVNPELLSPGKTGKAVAARHVFRDKASIMESARPIVYRTSKPTPMLTGGQVRFVAAGTVIRNYNPGGKQVKGSFEKFYNNWYATKINAVINSSGIIENIDKTTAAVLNKKGAGPAQVKAAIIDLLKQYSQGQDII